MAEQSVEIGFKSVVSALAAALKPLGFAKRGTKFRRGDTNVQLIEFQRSNSSDATSIKFTLNFGVVSVRALLRLDPEAKVAKSGILDAHLSERIGLLSEERAERWWRIDNQTDELAIGSDVIERVMTEALPWLQQYSSDEELVALWKSGRSPGLTEGQRIRYLAALS